MSGKNPEYRSPGSDSDTSTDNETDSESTQDEEDLRRKRSYDQFETRKEKGLKSGGAYSDVSKVFIARKGVLEVNHVIPVASYRETPFRNVRYRRMPCIIMRYCDHRDLHSTMQRWYRDSLQSFLQDGSFFQALRIEIISMWENHLLAEYENDFDQMLKYCLEAVIPNVPRRAGVRPGRLISSEEYDELRSLYQSMRDDPNPNVSRARERLFEKYLPQLDVEPGKKIQIFVKTITGKTITIEIDESATVEELKAKIEEKNGLPASQQRLVYELHNLQDGQTLRHYNIGSGSTVQLTLRLRGGK